MHRNSILLFERYARHLFKENMRVLEIGPDGHPSSFAQAVNDSSLKWETLDIFSAAELTYQARNEYEFPIADNAYDIVLSGQVIEHVRKIWLWIKELSRVCKVGGQVITINPVNYPFHAAPVDCWRIYPEGMTALYEEAGLVMQSSHSESLDPAPFYHRALKPLLRWHPEQGSVFVQAVDTISIGIKEAPNGNNR